MSNNNSNNNSGNNSNRNPVPTPLGKSNVNSSSTSSSSSSESPSSSSSSSSTVTTSTTTPTDTNSNDPADDELNVSTQLRKERRKIAETMNASRKDTSQGQRRGFAVAELLSTELSYTKEIAYFIENFWHPIKRGVDQPNYYSSNDSSNGSSSSSSSNNNNNNNNNTTTTTTNINSARQLLLSKPSLVALCTNLEQIQILSSRLHLELKAAVRAVRPKYRAAFSGNQQLHQKSSANANADSNANTASSSSSSSSSSMLLDSSNPEHADLTEVEKQEGEGQEGRDVLSPMSTSVSGSKEMVEKKTGLAMSEEEIRWCAARAAVGKIFKRLADVLELYAQYASNHAYAAADIRALSRDENFSELWNILINNAADMDDGSSLGSGGGSDSRLRVSSQGQSSSPGRRTSLRLASPSFQSLLGLQGGSLSPSPLTSASATSVGVAKENSDSVSSLSSSSLSPNPEQQRKDINLRPFVSRRDSVNSASSGGQSNLGVDRLRKFQTEGSSQSAGSRSFQLESGNSGESNSSDSVAIGRSLSNNSARGGPSPAGGNSSSSSRKQRTRLEGFLILPIQRVPRYELLLKEILKCAVPVDAWWVDWEEEERLAKESLNVTANVSQRMNEAIQTSEQDKKLVNFQNQFAPGTSLEFLTGKEPSTGASARRIVKEGNLVKIGRSGPKEYRFHLLSDALLYSEETSAGLKLHNTLALDMQCEVKSAPPPETSYYRYYTAANVSENDEQGGSSQRLRRRSFSSGAAGLSRPKSVRDMISMFSGTGQADPNGKGRNKALKDAPQEEGQNSRTNNASSTAFKIVTRRKTLYVFARSVAEKTAWMNAISDTLSTFRDRLNASSRLRANSSISRVSSGSTASNSIESPLATERGTENSSLRSILNCQTCGQSFNFFSRRISCGRCNAVVCTSCGSKKRVIDPITFVPERVCYLCTLEMDCTNHFDEPHLPRLGARIKLVRGTKVLTNLTGSSERAAKKMYFLLEAPPTDQDPNDEHFDADPVLRGPSSVGARSETDGNFVFPLDLAPPKSSRVSLEDRKIIIKVYISKIGEIGSVEIPLLSILRHPKSSKSDCEGYGMWYDVKLRPAIASQLSGSSPLNPGSRTAGSTTVSEITSANDRVSVYVAFRLGAPPKLFSLPSSMRPTKDENSPDWTQPKIWERLDQWRVLAISKEHASNNVKILTGGTVESKKKGSSEVYKEVVEKKYRLVDRWSTLSLSAASHKRVNMKLLDKVESECEKSPSVWSVTLTNLVFTWALEGAASESAASSNAVQQKKNIAKRLKEFNEKREVARIIRQTHRESKGANSGLVLKNSTTAATAELSSRSDKVDDPVYTRKRVLLHFLTSEMEFVETLEVLSSAFIEPMIQISKSARKENTETDGSLPDRRSRRKSASLSNAFKEYFRSASDSKGQAVGKALASSEMLLFLKSIEQISTVHRTFCSQLRERLNISGAGIRSSSSSHLHSSELSKVSSSALKDHNEQFISMIPSDVTVGDILGGFVALLRVYESFASTFAIARAVLLGTDAPFLVKESGDTKSSPDSHVRDSPHNPIQDRHKRGGAENERDERKVGDGDGDGDNEEDDDNDNEEGAGGGGADGRSRGGSTLSRRSTAPGERPRSSSMARRLSIRKKKVREDWMFRHGGAASATPVEAANVAITAVPWQKVPVVEDSQSGVAREGIRMLISSCETGSMSQGKDLTSLLDAPLYRLSEYDSLLNQLLEETFALGSGTNNGNATSPGDRLRGESTSSQPSVLNASANSRRRKSLRKAGWHPDTDSIRVAQDTNRDSVLELNRAMLREPNQAMLKHAVETLLHVPKTLQLIDQRRWLIREGYLVKRCRWEDKVLKFWLFSDALVYASRLGDQQYKFHRVIRLSDAAVRDLPGGTTPRSTTEKYGGSKSQGGSSSSSSSHSPGDESTAFEIASLSKSFIVMIPRKRKFALSRVGPAGFGEPCTVAIETAKSALYGDPKPAWKNGDRVQLKNTWYKEISKCIDIDASGGRRNEDAICWASDVEALNDDWEEETATSLDRKEQEQASLVVGELHENESSSGDDDDDERVDESSYSMDPNVRQRWGSGELARQMQRRSSRVLTQSQRLAHVAPVWTPNTEEHKSCAICERSFNVIVTRNHCRSCGQLVCPRCSPNKQILPHIDPYEHVKVCTRCEKQLRSDDELL